MHFCLPPLETMAVNPLFGFVIAWIFLLHYSLIVPCQLIILHDEKAPDTKEFAVTAHHALVH